MCRPRLENTRTHARTQEVADTKNTPMHGGHDIPPWEKALDNILHAAHNTMTVCAGPNHACVPLRQRPHVIGSFLCVRIIPCP